MREVNQNWDQQCFAEPLHQRQAWRTAGDEEFVNGRECEVRVWGLNLQGFDGRGNLMLEQLYLLFPLALLEEEGGPGIPLDVFFVFILYFGEVALDCI